jgi:hypothetical protein
MAKRKRQLIPVTTLAEGTEHHHFFASSAASWRTSADLDVVIEAMKAEGYPFNLWLVPGPEAQDYTISMFTPQVEGIVWLAFYGWPPKPGSP